MASRDDKIALLQHEIEGLRVQMASKEEVLGRCLEEIDRLEALIQKQEDGMKHRDKLIESLKAQLADVSHSEAKKTRHGYIPEHKKAELVSSCKITMAAKASNE